jgi:hypothetical protein
MLACFVRTCALLMAAPEESMELCSSFDHIPQNFRFFDFDRAWQSARVSRGVQ